MRAPDVGRAGRLPDLRRGAVLPRRAGRAAGPAGRRDGASTSTPSGSPRTSGPGCSRARSAWSSWPTGSRCCRSRRCAGAGRGAPTTPGRSTGSWWSRASRSSWATPAAGRSAAGEVGYEVLCRRHHLRRMTAHAARAVTLSPDVLPLDLDVCPVPPHGPAAAQSRLPPNMISSQLGRWPGGPADGCVPAGPLGAAAAATGSDGRPRGEPRRLAEARRLGRTAGSGGGVGLARGLRGRGLVGGRTRSSSGRLAGDRGRPRRRSPPARRLGARSRSGNGNGMRRGPGRRAGEGSKISGSSSSGSWPHRRAGRSAGPRPRRVGPRAARSAAAGGAGRAGAGASRRPGRPRTAPRRLTGSAASSPPSASTS